MSKFFICKLPHGLTISHKGSSVELRGANSSFNASTPIIGLNNLDGDAYGFGITELNDKDAATVEDWAASVTLVLDSDGKPTKTKLADPYPALDNGSIQGPFASEADAREEAKLLGSAVRTGFEPVDPDTDREMKAAGIEEVKENKGGKK